MHRCQATSPTCSTGKVSHKKRPHTFSIFIGWKLCIFSATSCFLYWSELKVLKEGTTEYERPLEILEFLFDRSLYAGLGKLRTHGLAMILLPWNFHSRADGVFSAIGMLVWNSCEVAAISVARLISLAPRYATADYMQNIWPSDDLTGSRLTSRYRRPLQNWRSRPHQRNWWVIHFVKSRHYLKPEPVFGLLDDERGRSQIQRRWRKWRPICVFFHRISRAISSPGCVEMNKWIIQEAVSLPLTLSLSLSVRLSLFSLLSSWSMRLLAWRSISGVVVSDYSHQVSLFTISKLGDRFNRVFRVF